MPACMNFRKHLAASYAQFVAAHDRKQRMAIMLQEAIVPCTCTWAVPAVTHLVLSCCVVHRIHVRPHDVFGNCRARHSPHGALHCSMSQQPALHRLLGQEHWT